MPAYIVFCRLHEMAPELFDALAELEAAVAEWRDGPNQSFKRIIAADDAAKVALAKVSGK
jgi:hypothetical protein